MRNSLMSKLNLYRNKPVIKKKTKLAPLNNKIILVNAYQTQHF